MPCRWPCGGGKCLKTCWSTQTGAASTARACIRPSWSNTILICSMSGKGNCYDNAVAESFFHTLKVEAVHGESFATREDMRQAVFEYIEVDDNRTRRHSANGPSALGL